MHSVVYCIWLFMVIFTWKNSYPLYKEHITDVIVHKPRLTSDFEFMLPLYGATVVVFVWFMVMSKGAQVIG